MPLKKSNFDHVLDAELSGAGQLSRAAGLSDYDSFTLYISKGENPKKPVPGVKLKGKGQNLYNDNGERTSGSLESCAGANRRLQIAPKSGC